MSDERLNDADPYRPDVVARLDGAEQHLLEEIMSTPHLDAVPLRRTLARRLTMAVAAAAVLAVAVTAATVARREPVEPYSGALGVAEGGGPAVNGWELDLKAAENLPRLIIDEPGWTPTSVYGFDQEDGSITFQNGGRGLSMNWYAAKHYQSYYDDRLEVSKPEWTTLAGVEASVVTYSESDFAAMRKPQDGTFVELRVEGGDWTRATFDELLPKVVKVDAETFLKSLPDEIITPGDVREEAPKLLADVPLPPGFDIASLEKGGANDPYQFGAFVAGQVTCGWIGEYQRADEAGDDAAAKKAAAALATSRQWKVLQDMNAAGDYPEVVWDLADKVGGGEVPEWYKDGLGC
ncbi:hypothetical protein ACTI_44360 [Actinoplanes sp. OR16]|uniref:hypothetical protein n=1 Tax=Actinoplanes sp. OR16 TaxID=946334 RepID=UPI000F6E56AE|nr:hypothetical protein [Actinoplanes sp. OR16]BBH67751.1 hypothetical protein ACTI_44360 [Actinoplanes sp. OR16]